MNLIRLLVIALVIYLVLQIFKRWAANKSFQSQVNKEKQVGQENQKQMVRCETCQLHIPKDEALQQDDKFFCSQEHLEGKQD